MQLKQFVEKHFFSVSPIKCESLEKKRIGIIFQTVYIKFNQILGNGKPLLRDARDILITGVCTMNRYRSIFWASCIRAPEEGKLYQEYWQNIPLFFCMSVCLSVCPSPFCRLLAQPNTPKDQPTMYPKNRIFSIKKRLHNIIIYNTNSYVKEY